MKLPRAALAAGLVVFSIAMTASAQDNKLRLLTWADYVPADVIADFKKETGIDVEVTLSNNEEMISKLRATGGAGFDLAQPSQDRIAGPQQEFGIYKPMDLGKIKARALHSARCSTRRRRTRRSTARSTGSRTSGAPTGWSSTPSSRRSWITRTCASRNSRARPACA